MRVLSVQVGRAKEYPYKGGVITSAIYKTPVVGRIPTRGHQLAGDEQADPDVHGGEDKAIYCYPHEHYSFWEERLGLKTLACGSFGENVTTLGLLEHEVCPGDRFRIGTIEVIATTPRMPCFKLGIRFGKEDMVARFLEAERPGIYFRIAKQGDVAADDEIECLSRTGGAIDIRTLSNLYSGRDKTPEKLAEASKLEAIPESWRARFSK